MGMGRFPSRVHRFLRHDVSGAGAVEFAMVAPVLLILLLGGSELGVALTVDRKVKAAAGAAVDLASQSVKLEDPDFRKLMGISRGTLAPYSTSTLAMRLTQIRINGKGEGTVDWSCGTTGYDKPSKGTPITIPPEFSQIARNSIADLLKSLGLTASQSALQDKAIYIVRGEAKYDFQPVTGAVFGKTVTLSGVTYVQPRYSDSVQSDSGGCSTFALQ